MFSSAKNIFYLREKYFKPPKTFCTAEKLIPFCIFRFPFPFSFSVFCFPFSASHFPFSIPFCVRYLLGPTIEISHFQERPSKDCIASFCRSLSIYFLSLTITLLFFYIATQELHHRGRVGGRTYKSFHFQLKSFHFGLMAISYSYFGE